MKLVIVTWVDSAQPVPGWCYLTDLPPNTAVQCKSVGWIVADSGESVMLAPNIGDEREDSAQASGCFRIPRASIIGIVEISPPGIEQ